MNLLKKISLVSILSFSAISNGFAQGPQVLESTTLEGTQSPLEHVRVAFYQRLNQMQVEGFEKQPGFFEAGKAALFRQEVIRSIHRYRTIIEHYAMNVHYVDGAGVVQKSQLSPSQITELHTLYSTIQKAGWLLPNYLLPEGIDRPITFGLKWKDVAVNLDQGFTLEQAHNPELLKLLTQLDTSYQRLEITKIFNERYIRALRIYVAKHLSESILDAKRIFQLSEKDVERLVYNLGTSEDGLLRDSTKYDLDVERLRFDYLGMNILDLVRAEVATSLNGIIQYIEMDLRPFPVNKAALHEVRFTRSTEMKVELLDPRSVLVQEAIRRAMFK